MSTDTSLVTQVAESRSVRSARAGRKLNRAEATALTSQIKATAGALWQLIAVAHDRKAWQALGYSTWKDYAVDELQMSESRSYQLIDTGRVMKAIGEVVGDTSVLETMTAVTARDTAKVKPHLSIFKRELKSALATLPAEQAVKHAISVLPDPQRQQPRAARPAEVQGEILDDHDDEPRSSLLDAYNAEQAERASRGRAGVAVPTFTATETTTARQIIVPKGRAVCEHCHGAGYL